MWNLCDSNEFGNYFDRNSKSCGIIVSSVGFKIILIEIPSVVELLWFRRVLELSKLEVQELWNYSEFGYFWNYSIEIPRVVKVLWFRWVCELFQLECKELWNYCDVGELGNYLNWNSKNCGIIVISVSFGIILIEIPRVAELLWVRWIWELF